MSLVTPDKCPRRFLVASFPVLPVFRALRRNFLDANSKILKSKLNELLKLQLSEADLSQI